MARGETLGQAIAEESRSALDAYVREGARQMLQAALECDVDAFLAEYADRADEHGRKQVIRNGYLPARTIMTGAGPLEIEQPRVRDKSRHADEQWSSRRGSCHPICGRAGPSRSWSHGST